MKVHIMLGINKLDIASRAKILSMLRATPFLVDLQR